jgi:hypothetical protein
MNPTTKQLDTKVRELIDEIAELEAKLAAIVERELTRRNEERRLNPALSPC